MNDWTIRPYKGIGGLQFGMERSTTREILGAKVETFSKTLNDLEEVDAYDSLGLHLYFDDKDFFEFAEAFPPCEPQFGGIFLLRGDAQEVVARLKDMGYEGAFDDGGYFFHDIGIALYAPSNDMEGVSIYRLGYYDDDDE